MRIPNCRICAVPWFLWTHADPCRNPTCGKDELTLSFQSFFPRTRFSSDCLLEPEFPGETVCNVASMCFMFSVCGELCLVLQNVRGLRKYRDAWEQNDMEWLGNCSAPFTAGFFQDKLIGDQRIRCFFFFVCFDFYDSFLRFWQDPDHWGTQIQLSKFIAMHGQSMQHARWWMVACLNCRCKVT